MNKKGTFITAFASALILILIFFIIFMLFSTAGQKTDAYSQASLELGKFYVFDKIVTSRNCISTGEIGILDKELLDAASASGGELEYAALPDYAHYVRVDDLTNGESWDWKFGYTGGSKWEDTIECYVSIKNGDKLTPGFLKVTVISKEPSIEDQDDDVLMCLTGGAERAWVKGEYNVNCYCLECSIQTEAHFKEDEICLETGGTEVRCRSLRGETKLEENYRSFYNNNMISVSYKRVGDVVKVT